MQNRTDADAFARKRVEHGVQHGHDKMRFLVFIDFNDALPVSGHFIQSIILADVNQIQNVFFKTGPAESHAGIQKFRTDPGVHANGSGHLGHIGLGFLTKRGNGVDRGYPLGQKCIGNQLGQLAAPDIRGQNPLPGNPIGVDFRQRVSGL